MQQERDLEETKRINIEIMMQIEEGKKQNIKEDRDTTNKDIIDNLHKNGKMSSPSKSEV